jgi:protein-L-isoaspartate(D-aspartate) O-methyltransferase
MPDYAAARGHMVHSQLKPNRVCDPRVIAAMAEIPRELFVPDALSGVAYVDEDIAVGSGRYLMEPMVLAWLLQAANAGPDDIALDVGCATGYSTAVLAQLAGTVVALESDADLAVTASALLAKREIGNAVVVTGALAEGYPQQGPYDVIVLNGSVERVPDVLGRQLVEEGRLVAIVGGGRAAKGVLMTRSGGRLSSRPLVDAAVPPLPGFGVAGGFVF